MRRQTLLLMLLCLHIAARGQTTVNLNEIDLSWLPQPTQVKALRYWFDNDAGRVQTVNSGSGTYLLETASLTDGLHTLNYQVIDSEDNAAYISSHVFMKMNSNSIANVQSLRYWFDDDAESVQTVNGGSGTYLLETASLTNGLHTLHYQVVGSDGSSYYVTSGIFMKLTRSSEMVTVSKLMYWYDEETTLQTIELGEGVQMLNASELTEGLHTLHYQLLCSNGQVTPTVTTVFMRINFNVDVAPAKMFRYWFDNDTTAQEVAAGNGVQMLDASMLHEGLHTIHCQIRDSRGALGASVSSIFVKMGQATTTTAKSIRYWFDNDVTSVKEIDVAEGSQTLDVTDLLAGLHTLNYQLIDSDGKAGIPVTRMFMRDFDNPLAEGGNSITRYQYWLNRNSQAMQTVELSDAPNPYTLIGLLPLQKEPIHSDCFQFEVTDGQPTIYAKNVFHIRFHDARGYFTDGEKTFVDYSVKQVVTDMEWLESGVRATTAKPTEDAIKWYCLEAEPGDSLQFKLDRAATIQLFSPSGMEVFRASGAESVVWGGLHASEAGTFYLALHDVTAQQGTTVSIDYNHIDKYAVLRQDVTVVGNGGCSTITFEGNGFRNLYAVDLFTEQGDSIHHVYIGHESDATTSVVFDFTDAILGTYHAKFRFADEDKVFNNLITVEEARDIELATTVTYPSTFLRGNGKSTYNVRIANHGNMTSYRTPIYIYVASRKADGVNRIKIAGLSLPILYNGIERNSLCKEDNEWMSEIAEIVGDTHYFLKNRKWDASINDSIYIWSAYFFTDIAPNREKAITIDVSTIEPINVWVTTPKANIPLASHSNDRIENARFCVKKISHEELCCMRSKVECVTSIITDGVGIASKLAEILGPGSPWDTSLGIASCLADAINQMVSATGEILCGDLGSIHDELGDKIKAATNGISIISTLSGCASKLLPGGKLKSFLEALNKLAEGEGWMSALGISIDFLGCEEAFTHPIPDCPPNPDGGGGSSSPVNSYDPNEIFGYTASSGSHAVKDEQTDVYYRIEFENDTTFATVAAHDIYVTDTLEATKFDLSTFAPTRVRIGEKSAELTGDKNFVTTIDMRPEINAIAQVEGTFDEQKGIAKWHVSSLDPMTMEPTKDVMQGVLPVNFNGNGIGEVSYDIKLKPNLAHGTEINNRAGIVFDQNEVIMTPTWTNVIDRIAPESHVADVRMLNDSTATVSIEATDELSGPLRYDVYVQYGEGSGWWKAAESVPADTTANIHVYEGIDHGFYVVMTDSAGNAEKKEAAREFTLEVFGSQIDTNTKVELAQGWNWISHNQNDALLVNRLQTNAQQILGQDGMSTKDAQLGWTGDLTRLLPTQMYKVLVDEPMTIQLNGQLFNANYRDIPLYEGWNWIGYPVAHKMTPTEALQKLQADEGDFLIGQDGLATYSDGQWTGTLLEMHPGRGYMYKSASDKNLFYNASAQASARRIDKGRQNTGNDSWTVDKRKYPNVMGVVAQLWLDNVRADASDWLLAAFCGDECRGLAQTVGDVLMMNVYGTDVEPISFVAQNLQTGELLVAKEQEPFRADVVGTLQQPLQLHIGEATGIAGTESMPQSTGQVFDLQGRLVGNVGTRRVASVAKGIYVVTSKERTQKVVKR